MSSSREEVDQGPYKWAWPQAARQGILAGESKTKARYLDGQLTWNMPSATETETRIIAAAWNAWHMLGQFWKKKSRWTLSSSATSSKQPYRAHCCQACALLSSTAKELFPLEACQSKLARRPVAMTRRNCGGEPNKQQIPIKVLCQLQWSQNSTLGLGQKSDSANSKI